MRLKHASVNRLRGQQGLTLIEFMISITLGMILVAALAVLIGNQSTNRSELDRTARMIENGRYAIRTIVEDLQMAGYWGEIISSGGSPTSVTTLAAMPDPCSATLTDLRDATFLHIQGYDASTFTSSTLSCVTNWKSGTDVLVVRRADPDFSAVVNSSGVTDLAKLTDRDVYLQTGLTSATGTVFGYGIYTGNSATNSTNFTLVKRDGTLAPPRKLVVHIYFVATCDVCTGLSADTIPTLKRLELAGEAVSLAMGNPVTIAEGVEDLQIDYGVDDGQGASPVVFDGAPDGSDVNAASTRLGSTVPDNWRNAMSAKIYLLARGTEKSATSKDSKSYCMGTSYPSPSGCYSPSTADAAYQRHLFTQTVRLTNPSLRRSS